MRLRTVTAPDARQAMARLRADLGADAIIVATQQVDGGVRITGAVENDEVDLGALLAAPQTSPCVERLARVAAHHELPPGRARSPSPRCASRASTEPVAALGHALHQLYRFGGLAAACPTAAQRPARRRQDGIGRQLAARAVLEGRTVAVLSTEWRARRRHRAAARPARAAAARTPGGV